MEKLGIHKDTTEIDEAVVKEPLIKKFPKGPRKGNIIVIVITLLVVVAGVFSGWYLSGNKGFSNKESKVEVNTNQKGSITEAGLPDTSSLPDQAEGSLVSGGIKGEGTHHLEREGGSSKNVYLTSTVIDLESFVGKKVHIWGETISGVYAGWLMDVGKIKVIE